MSYYAVAIGHDNTAYMTTLTPQPDEEHPGGSQYAQVDYAPDGSVALQGAYYTFIWSEITQDDYEDILEDFGLDSAHSAEVTIYARDDMMKTWGYYNGVALRPLPGDTVRWNNRPQRAIIIVRNLEAVAE